VDGQTVKNATPVAKINSSSINLTQFLTYTDRDLGFQINYPIDWIKQTDQLFDNSAVIFYAPNEAGVGLFIKFNRQVDLRNTSMLL
jgi:hypothetical protein